jgi:anti-sigma B factor antagonist
LRRERPGADGAFQVIHRRVERHSVLLVRGELDDTHAPEVGRAVHRALATNPQRLVIDLSAVAFVNYRGLSVLLSARRRELRLGVELSLACDVPSTLRLLAQTRLDRDFEIHATSADARSDPGNNGA